MDYTKGTKVKLNEIHSSMNRHLQAHKGDIGVIDVGFEDGPRDKVLIMFNNDVWDRWWIKPKWLVPAESIAD